MKLTGEQAREIVYGDNRDWLYVKGTRETTGNSRWAVEKQAVFTHEPTGKTYQFYWQEGATESQSERPFEYDHEYEPTEVVEKEVVTKQWVPV